MAEVVHRPPKCKGSFNSSHASSLILPYPIPASNDLCLSDSSSLPSLPMFCGTYVGDAVWVMNNKQSIWLYEHGCYGKGTMSRSRPIRCATAATAEAEAEAEAAMTEGMAGRHMQMKRKKSNTRTTSKKMKYSEQMTSKTNVWAHIRLHQRQNGPHRIYNAQRHHVGSPSTSVINSSPPPSSPLFTLKLVGDGKQPLPYIPALSSPMMDVMDKYTAARQDLEENLYQCKENNSVRESHSRDEYDPFIDPGLMDMTGSKGNYEEYDPFSPGMGDEVPRRSHREREAVGCEECLQLGLEEAFFLAWGLGCLNIFDSNGSVMPLRNVWRSFAEVQCDFVFRYAVYHHFRSRGWVVKDGIKFGADFVLYERSPAYSHASYMIRVVPVNAVTLSTLSESYASGALINSTWADIVNQTRVAEQVSKDCMTIYVLCPPNSVKGARKSPKVLSSFSIHETLTRRWRPSSNFEKDK